MASTEAGNGKGLIGTAKLPDGVSFVSAADGDYTKENHAVIWTIPDVPSGEEGVVSVVVRVNETAVVKSGTKPRYRLAPIGR